LTKNVLPIVIMYVSNDSCIFQLEVLSMVISNFKYYWPKKSFIISFPPSHPSSWICKITKNWEIFDEFKQKYLFPTSFMRWNRVSQQRNNSLSFCRMSCKYSGIPKQILLIFWQLSAVHFNWSNTIDLLQR